MSDVVIRTESLTKDYGDDRAAIIREGLTSFSAAAVIAIALVAVGIAAFDRRDPA